MDEHVNGLLRKAVAVQVKNSLKNKRVEGNGGGDDDDENVDISLTKDTFNDLCLLLDFQLNYMVKELEKLSLLQRRHVVSKDDLTLWLRGFNIDCTDLYYNYIEKFKDKKANTLVDINCAKTSRDNHTSYDEFNKILNEQKFISSNLNLINKQTSIDSLQNKINRCNNIFPNLPPDHTYKFTSQFNSPITDERLIKKSLVNESKLTEIALLNLLNKENKNDDEDDNKLKKSKVNEDDEKDKYENIALFGINNDDSIPNEEKTNNDGDNILKTKRSKYRHYHHDFKIYYNKSFDVKEYALNRINLQRNKVKNFEIKKIIKKNNPLINNIKLFKNNTIINAKNNSTTISNNNNNEKINLILQKSLFNFINYSKGLPIKKQKIVNLSINQREKRLNMLKEKFDANNKQNKKIMSNKSNNNSTDIIINDIAASRNLNNINNDSEDVDMELFGELDDINNNESSSDIEEDGGLMDNSTSTLSSIKRQPNMAIDASIDTSEIPTTLLGSANTTNSTSIAVANNTTTGQDHVSNSLDTPTTMQETSPTPTQASEPAQTPESVPASAPAPDRASTSTIEQPI